MSRGGYGKLKLNGKYVYPYPYYPVGAIVLFGNNTNPNDIYIGKWVQLKDVFILACGDKYKVGDTGGEATHKLTANEMPTHEHKVAERNSVATGTMANIDVHLSHNGPAGNDYVYYGPPNNDWILRKGYLYSGYAGMYALGAGGDQAHNNMPPYVAKYYWERVA